MKKRKANVRFDVHCLRSRIHNFFFVCCTAWSLYYTYKRQFILQNTNKLWFSSFFSFNITLMNVMVVVGFSFIRRLIFNNLYTINLLLWTRLYWGFVSPFYSTHSWAFYIQFFMWIYSNIPAMTPILNVTPFVV